MERRDFLVLGATGSALLSGCSVQVRSSRSSPPAPRPEGGPLRLNANENPLGLSPAARQAILEGLGEANRYPRQWRTDLVAAVAAKHGLNPDQVQLGTGSTEILQMAVQTSPSDAVMVVAEPTFEELARYAAASGRRVVTVPLRGDWAHDVAAMRRAAGSGPALVYLCNPNNPTATITPCDEIDAWIADADPRVTFLVDEAYFEFVDDPGYRSATPWIASKPNVVVMRTFSKIQGMAGLRLGYALAQPATIQRLQLMACSNGANQLALTAGIAALGDSAFHERSVASNRAARAVLTSALGALGLARLPSQANFLMHRIQGPMSTYITRMRDAGFQVGRPFPPMLDYSRVSIGTTDQMERFAGTLRSFRAQGWV